MPFLYDGLPDRPEWLRRWWLRRSQRGSIRRDARRLRKGESLTGEQLMRQVNRGRRRYARRKRVVGIITDPSVTFGLQLLGAPLVAVQLDRLTRGDGTGSVALIVLGAGALAASVWFARTREAVLEREADIHESEWLERHFVVIDEAISTAADEAANDRRDDLQHILAALRDIESRLP